MPTAVDSQSCRRGRRSIGKTLIQKIADTAQQQERQNPHAAAAGAKETAKEHPADGTAKKTTHQPSPETAGLLWHLLLPLLAELAGRLLRAKAGWRGC